MGRNLIEGVQDFKLGGGGRGGVRRGGGEGEGEGEGRGKGGKRRGGMYEVLSTHDEAWSYSGGSTPQVW